MFGFDDVFLATFAEAAPEMFGMGEAAGALGAAEALGTAGTTAAMQGGFGSGLASAAASNPELLTPNFLAEAAQSQAVNSGIMQGANPEVMQSVANFSPPTSIYGPESEQVAGIKGVNLGKAAVTPPQITPDTYGRIGPLNTPTPMASGVQDIQQFSNPSPTTGMSSGIKPTEVPGATPPVASNPAAYQYNPATGEYASANPQSALERGWDKASAWAEKNPFKAAGIGYIGASKLGLLDQKGMDAPAPYNGPLSKYRMSPNFQARQANPEDYRYTPRVYNYAQGGIAEAPELPVYRGEIARDDDPDTRYLDPLTAAMVRQSKLNSRSHVNTPANFSKPTPMGTLNFKPVAAAQGGIMGYAAGGDVGDDEFKRLTSRSDNRSIDVAPIEKFNPVNTAIWASDHPIAALPGRYLTSPTSSIGMLANLIDPKGTQEANLAFNGVNPEAYARNEAQPSAQAQNIRGLESQFGPGSEGGAAAGPSDSAQAENRADVGQSGLAHGGIASIPYSLGGYASGGNPRLLRGPGDGMSDNIPATINNRQPARLADGEFVVPADVVSHLGNGSTEAGAKKLHEMMTQVRKARTGNPKQGKEINPNRFMPK
jgi:hypothetical protein